MLSTLESFNIGYETTKSKEITLELTAKEIAERYPDCDIDAFANGMNDALNKDNWRYTCSGGTHNQINISFG